MRTLLLIFSILVATTAYSQYDTPPRNEQAEEILLTILNNNFKDPENHLALARLMQYQNMKA